jgi:hypothetical protein
MLALTALAAEVRVVAPSTLMPAAIERMYVQPFTDFDAALEGADVVMMLRVQNERMEGGYIPSTREFHMRYGLTPERLALAKPDALVMHPGPMNRGVEIDSSVADGRALARSPSRSRWASPCAWPASTYSPDARAAWRAGHEYRLPQREARLPVGVSTGGDLLVEGETIAAIGAFDTPEAPKSIDLAGKMLAPALIDLGVFAVDKKPPAAPAASRASG